MKKKQPMKRKSKRSSYRKKTTSLVKNVNVRRDVHYFRRFAYKSTITADVSRTAKGALTFAIQDVPGLSDFTSLFDYYMLTGVKVRFTTLLDPNSQAAGNSYFPKIYTAVDNDDDTAPLSSDDLRQRSNCKIRWLGPNRSYDIFLRPKYLKNVYISGVSTGYEIGKQTWLDLSNTNIPHYGLKYVIENLNPDLGQQVQVEVTYYISMRGTR